MPITPHCTDMNIKPCRQCGEVAPHYNGITTCCKKCWRVRVTARRNAKIDEIRAYDRERGKLPHRKEMYAAKRKRMRMNRHGMMSAHNAVARKLQKEPSWKPLRCERCGAKNGIQAHHDNYAKPLDVLWLCPVCHAVRHKELGRLNKPKGGTNE